MSKTVIYYCYGPQTVWISTIMSETVNAGCTNIAIMRKELAKGFNFDAGFFERVYFLEQDLVKQVQKIICDEKPSIFAIFTWGGDSNLEVYNAIPDTVKTVLIDEGTASYNYEKHFTVFSGEVDFSKVSEVWLLDPAYSLNKGQIPVYRIPIKEYLDDKKRFSDYIARINRLFAYKDTDFEGVMLFDNYFVQGGFMTEELYNSFVENIMLILGKNKTMIKSHPTESEYMFDRRYGKYDVVRFGNDSLPWEVIVLNYLFKRQSDDGVVEFPKLLMAVNTSALITTQTLLSYYGYEVPIVFTCNLIHDWLPDSITITEEVLNNYKATYPLRSVYMPEKWVDLTNILKDYIDDINEECLKYIEKKESELAAEIKLNYGNCLAKSRRFDRIVPLIECTDSFKKYLDDNGYMKIAIYGFGDVGKLLRNQLLADGFDVIVAEKTHKTNIISIRELKGIIENLDLVIVTPILDFEQIRGELGNYDYIVGYEDFITRIRST